MLMSNQRITDLITNKLPQGLIHPGDGANQKPTLLQLPGFRTTGLPPEYVKQVTTTTRMLAEAIVNLIETDGKSAIIDRDELDQLRATTNIAENNGTDIIAVHCRRCNTHLLTLRPLNSSKATIDGHALVTSLSKLPPTCPHKAAQ